jgi:hypothetical protein
MNLEDSKGYCGDTVKAGYTGVRYTGIRIYRIVPVAPAKFVRLYRNLYVYRNTGQSKFCLLVLTGVRASGTHITMSQGQWQHTQRHTTV